MYFRNRAAAGDLLAEKLSGYRYADTAVLALSAGGVLVGEQIARRLHSALSLLMITNISLPGDESLVVGTMDHTGLFTSNDMIPAGEMEDIMADMHGWLEEAKMRHMYDMAAIRGEHGLADPAQLAGRNIIITTDGLSNGLSYYAARHFLERIPTEKLIAAVPVGPFDAIDFIRPLMDETYCLYMPSPFFDTAHYYTDEAEPSTAEVMPIIDDVVKRWI